ncbi:MAG TPA: hypothetical protein VMR75_01620 [Candidatus Saccharimonadales bacterium]|nr:hypothetical protein [Candidatus Saccharimonadales bacterium]
MLRRLLLGALLCAMCAYALTGFASGATNSCTALQSQDSVSINHVYGPTGPSATVSGTYCSTPVAVTAQSIVVTFHGNTGVMPVGTPTESTVTSNGTVTITEQQEFSACKPYLICSTEVAKVVLVLSGEGGVNFTASLARNGIQPG